MPTVVLERFDSRAAADGEAPQVTLRYVVHGAADYDAALSAVEAEAPLTLGALLRRTWRVDPEGDGSQLWTGEVDYAQPSAASYQTGDSSFEFDTTFAGGVRLYQALEHVADYAPAGKTAPNHQGAINVVRDASGLRVEGVDLAPPGDALRFSVTRYQAAVNLSTLLALSGCTNTGSWSVSVEGVSGTFGDREVLFLGASGSKRRCDDWSIRYGFCASPSVTGLTIGAITGIAKKGMDYLWVEYADDPDDSSKSLVKKPLAAHVERVWRTGDFSALGIPGVP